MARAYDTERELLVEDLHSCLMRCALMKAPFQQMLRELMDLELRLCISWREVPIEIPILPEPEGTASDGSFPCIVTKEFRRFFEITDESVRMVKDQE